MFTVYPHEWKELASASATCAQRTAAQTAASPESPAVCRARGWLEAEARGEGAGEAPEEVGRASADPDGRVQGSTGKRGEKQGRPLTTKQH